MRNIFATADWHEGHHNILKYDKRPFASIEEMREELIKRHNSVVGKYDIVYNLGDMFWRTCGLKTAIETVGRLNGEQHYIFGNHEEIVLNNYDLRSKFASVSDVKWIRSYDGPGIKHPGIMLCHYAMRVWRNSHRGSFHLFGHSHGSIPGTATSLDVGVNSWDYYPVSLETISAEFNRRLEFLKSPECKAQLSISGGQGTTSYTFDSNTKRPWMFTPKSESINEKVVSI